MYHILHPCRDNYKHLISMDVNTISSKDLSQGNIAVLPQLLIKILRIQPFP